MGFFDSFKESANKTINNLNNRAAEANQYKQQFMGKSKDELRRIISSSSGNKKLGAMAAYRDLYGN
jgi:hypothetical protein